MLVRQIVETAKAVPNPTTMTSRTPADDYLLDPLPANWVTQKDAKVDAEMAGKRQARLDELVKQEKKIIASIKAGKDPSRLRPGEPPLTLDSGGGRALAFSANDLLATTGASSTMMGQSIKIWSLATGKDLQTLETNDSL